MIPFTDLSPRYSAGIRTSMVIDGLAYHRKRNQTASIVDGGFEAMLYVTLTTPGTS